MVRRRGVVALWGVAVLAGTVSTERNSRAATPVIAKRLPHAVSVWTTPALRFQPVISRFGAGAHFIARVPGATVAFGLDRHVLRIAPLQIGACRAVATLGLDLQGANPHPIVAPVGLLPDRINYLLGRDPRAWRTNIPTYAGLVYRNVYPGIDLTFHGAQSGRTTLEYDWTLHPGADPHVIRFSFSGADRVVIDGSGGLYVSAAGFRLVQRQPVAAALSGARRVPISARYEHRGGGIFGIRLGAHNIRQSLVIDPVVLFSTYLGGSGNDSISGVAVTHDGSTVVVGSTTSSDFPTMFPLYCRSAGARDVVITELDPAGQPVFSTYLGGAGDDRATSVALDRTGAMYVTGSTSSLDFPTRNAWQHRRQGGVDGFVAHINATGNAVLYSTYLGGSRADTESTVAVDASGAFAVGGATQSSDFPLGGPVVTHLVGTSEGTVTFFNPNGEVRWSRYLGGGGGARVTALAFARDTLVAAGEMHSAEWLPAGVAHAISGGSNGFLARLNVGGSVTAATAVGGRGENRVNGIAVDATGAVVAVGTTSAGGLPGFIALVPHGSGDGLCPSTGCTDAFLARWDGTASPPTGILLGGSGDDRVAAVALHGDTAVLAGTTDSLDFPVVPAGDSLARSGTCSVPAAGTLTCSRGFLATVSLGSFTLQSLISLGGSGNDTVTALGLDAGGNALVAGSTRSPDFPVHSAVQPLFGGETDGFVTRVSLGLSPEPSITIVRVALERRSHGRFVPSRFLRIGQMGRWTLDYRITPGDAPPPSAREIIRKGTHVLFDGAMDRTAPGVFQLQGRFHAVVGHLTATYVLTTAGVGAVRTARFIIKLPK